MTKSVIHDQSVRAAFEAFPRRVQLQMKRLRRLILDVAHDDPHIGELTETLRWGEPAYIPNASGSLVRLGWKSRTPEEVLLLFHCQTSLVSDFRARFGDTLQFQKDRAIILPVDSRIDEPIIRTCVHHAFTYKRRTTQEPAATP
jgi:hypothetical protein